MTQVSANRVKKEEKVTAYDDMKDAGIVVVTQQVGLNAEQTRQLRVQFLKEQVDFKIGKNTLAKLAFKDSKLAGLEQLLKGPTALAYSKDPIAAARVAVEFAKKNDKLKIIGAAMNGQMLDEVQTKALASLPSLDVLRGRLVGLLLAPATKIAGILQAPAAQLARVMGAKAAKGE